jgi:hypothetical protein
MMAILMLAAVLLDNTGFLPMLVILVVFPALWIVLHHMITTLIWIQMSLTCLLLT